VEFIAVDNPHANKLTVHILAAVAQHEREMISARTSAALKAAKARGKQLGNPTLSEARRHAVVATKERARAVCGRQIYYEPATESLGPGILFSAHLKTQVPSLDPGLAFDEPTNVTELRLIILVLADELVPDERVGISEALAIKIARGRGGVPPSRGSIAVRPRCGAMRLRPGERRRSDERGQGQACDKSLHGTSPYHGLRLSFSRPFE
jgi:hypothetical protein